MSVTEERASLNFDVPMWTVRPIPIPDVVYCRECVWLNKQSGSGCRLSGLSVGPNDFCSKGERMSNHARA